MQIKCGRCGEMVEFGNHVECSYTWYVNKPDGTVESVSETESVCQECYKAM